MLWSAPAIRCFAFHCCIRTPNAVVLREWILVLADDLTGALEVGAKFAQCGLRTLVTVEPTKTPTPDLDVLVIDTETRHLTEEQAFNVVGIATEACLPFAPRLIYKKTDSTLRGNIAAELRALQSVLPGCQIVYAPAYPELGRFVRDGHLYVNEIPLHLSAFANDPLNPVQTSHVHALLDNPSILVLDGESNLHIEEAAGLIKQLAPPALAAGPGALAGALAKQWASPTAAPSFRPSPRRCLVVNGSLHPASLGQMQFAKAANCFNQSFIPFVEPVPGSGLARANLVGQRVRMALADTNADALVVFGGDTAFSIHASLGAADFLPLAELMPGVPISRCGNLIWITKAGGFGSPDLLPRLQRILK